MVTNYPQDIVTRGVGATVEPYAGRVFSRLWKRVQFALCSLHGHEPLLHYDQNRIYLRCASCGHETPGWELDDRRPRVRFHGDPQHHYVRHPETVAATERKIA
jgi:hypothetical protein